MLLDKSMEFADALAVSAAAGTAALPNVVDLGPVARDIGVGNPLFVVIQVTTDFASAGAATVTFSLATDSTEALSTDGSATVHVSTGAIAYTALTAGKAFALQIPYTAPEYERYMGILVTTGTATTTAGAINAFITTTPQAWRAYPEAVN